MAAGNAPIPEQRKRGPKPKGQAAQSRKLRDIAVEMNSMATLLDSRTTEDLTFNPAIMQQNFSNLFSSSKVFRAYNYVVIEYENRRARQQRLPPDLFGEPGWDMLLYLYIQQVKAEPVTVTPLCMASGVPHTTALRYIDSLQAHALIEKRRSDTDARAAFVQLSPDAFETLTDMFDR